MNTLSIAFKFGGQNYTFAGIDLILDDVSGTPGLAGMCLTSLFNLGSVLDNQVTGTNGPAWLVGDAFLKNVYTVFRSVDVPYHPHHHSLIQPVPDMRRTRQERSVAQSALLGSVAWMAV